MPKIEFDTRLYVDFGEHEIRLAKSNFKNQSAVREAYFELINLAPVTKDKEKEIQKIKDDHRLKESTKNERIENIKLGVDDSDGEWMEKMPEGRKKVLDLIVDKWMDGEPDDEYYSNDNFDDYALGRLVSFFLRPVIQKDKQSTSSGN